ncbi:isochorismatase family cysteine hydrolase [Paraglaciecola sp.]|uniref:isochorismatase family cysteine hydrolase n=1 Tax=Paraglaciecola sp. TaxID=1920173 RepID=UPI00326313E7
MNEENSALIVIDLQNDFTLKTGKAHACASQADLIIPKINALIKTCEQKNIDVIYFKTEWKNLLVKLLTKNSVKVGSYGAELDSRLTSDNKSIFVKNNKNIFSDKHFTEYLQQHKITNLYLSGLAVEFCINTSFREAQKLKIKTNIVSDLVISYKCTDLEPLLGEFFPTDSLILSTNLVK